MQDQVCVWVLITQVREEEGLTVELWGERNRKGVDRDDVLWKVCWDGGVCPRGNFPVRKVSLRVDLLTMKPLTN